MDWVGVEWIRLDFIKCLTIYVKKISPGQHLKVLILSKINPLIVLFLHSVVEQSSSSLRWKDKV